MKLARLCWQERFLQKIANPPLVLIVCEMLGCDINRLAYSKPGRDFTMIQGRPWSSVSLNMALSKILSTGRSADEMHPPVRATRDILTYIMSDVSGGVDPRTKL